MSLTQIKFHVANKPKGTGFRTAFAYVLKDVQESHLPNPLEKQSKYVSLSLCCGGARIGTAIESRSNHKNEFFRDFVTYVNPGVSGYEYHQMVLKQISLNKRFCLNTVPWTPNFRERPWLIGTARAGAFHFLSNPSYDASVILPLDDGVDPSFLRVNEKVMAVTDFNRRKKMFPLYTKDHYKFDRWISDLFKKYPHSGGWERLGTFPKKWN